ncbi:phytoene/squalene synthase family protein [Amycolatopsis sp. FDAARGOS 1241]|uniref:phytoene/squalene synthase family protein n=1 Tax=Amycolatopsis sp. FDAARGOS 1241 TaxID=2778070 RepID=UPI0019502960|nr:phytoene/squalene synthase family protein [Amycolatopsis sp. FDAARGOS 1241]QRP42667.1 phytoene/squalene synthase family protein [Amycolatopsis sp. FDAARGOS 1241]
MTRRELDAAGIHDPALRSAYQRCRTVNARHGRTYFLATRLLSPAQRPPVHALYGFARRLDDIVDKPAGGATPATITAELDAVERDFFSALAARHSDDPLLASVIDTCARYEIATRHFRAFFRSMRMDLTVTDYPRRSALDEYVHGSAEVIGLQVLPVLGTVTGRDEAAPHAAALGKAFQLTNFLRDVAEDLARNRVYLPADELAAFGVDRDRLGWCADRGLVDRQVRAALAAQIAVTRTLYDRARPGICMLHPVSRACVGTAFQLYAEILDRIERAGYNVFGHRAVVPRRRRLLVAAGALGRARWLQLRNPSPLPPAGA